MNLTKEILFKIEQNLIFLKDKRRNNNIFDIFNLLQQMHDKKCISESEKKAMLDIKSHVENLDLDKLMAEGIDESSALNMNIETIWFVGFCYMYGILLEENLEKAMKFYKITAQCGFPLAEVTLGWCYINGRGVGKDVAKGVDLCQLSANKGCGSAQYLLACCYYNGQGVQKDLKVAAEYFEKAADQNHPLAQNSIGVMYKQREGVEQNHDKAIHYLTKAAEQNVDHAQFNLGHSYEFGLGVTQDINRAVELYQLAAAQGNARAQNFLGVCFARGIVVKQDRKCAFDLYLQAALQGLDLAQYNVGFAYRDGKGVEKDLKKALEFFEKAANQGHLGAQSELGNFYQKGLETKKDENRAFEIYQKAAAQGEVGALVNMASCYLTGSGVTKDILYAVEIYKKIVQQHGDSEALFLLGNYYLNLAQEKSLVRACLLWKAAAKLGHRNARIRFREESEYRHLKLNLSELIAAKEYNLVAFCHELGLEDLPVNIEEAIKYYQLEAKENSNSNFDFERISDVAETTAYRGLLDCYQHFGFDSKEYNQFCAGVVRPSPNDNITEIMCAKILAIGYRYEIGSQSIPKNIFHAYDWYQALSKYSKTFSLGKTKCKQYSTLPIYRQCVQEATKELLLEPIADLVVEYSFESNLGALSTSKSYNRCNP